MNDSPAGSPSNRGRLASRGDETRNFRVSSLELSTGPVEATFPVVLSLSKGFSPEVELRPWRLGYDSHGVAVSFAKVLVVCHEASWRTWFELSKRAGQSREKPQISVKGLK